MMNTTRTILLLVLLAMLGPGCGDDGDVADGDADADSDADVDADVDGDGDGDTDADTDGDTDADGDGDAFAPENLDGKSVTLAEQNGGPTNTWTFPDGAGTAGTATLVGVSDFPFTYAKTGPSTSVLEFDVDGTDKYEMVWTSVTGGSFEESFEGNPGNPGTFTVE